MQDLWGKGKDFIKWLLGRWNDCFTSKPMKNTTTVIEWISIYKHSCHKDKQHSRRDRVLVYMKGRLDTIYVLTWFCQGTSGVKNQKWSCGKTASNLCTVQATHFTFAGCVSLPTYFQCTKFQVAKGLEHYTAQMQKKKLFQNSRILSFKNMVEMSSLYHHESCCSSYIFQRGRHWSSFIEVARIDFPFLLTLLRKHHQSQSKWSGMSVLLDHQQMPFSWLNTKFQNASLFLLYGATLRSSHLWNHRPHKQQ